MPRVAACSVCYRLERLTDPPKDVPYVPATVRWNDHGVEREYTFTEGDEKDGPPILVPQFDPVMEDFVGRHGHNRPDSDMNYIKVFPVDQRTWEKMDAVTYIKSELARETGQIWEELDHYKKGALECYNKHGNPDSNNRCIDFRDDSKRIGPKTPPKFQSYLCDVCPYMQSYIASEMRSKAGLYDPKSVAVRRSQRRRK